MHGLVVHHLGGEPRAFRLTVPAYFRLADPWAVFQRLVRGEWTLADVVTVLRATLEGAGTPQAQAASIAAIPLHEARHAALVAADALRAAFTVPDDGDEPGGDSDGEKPTLGGLYKSGFAIGLKPREIDQMTIWELSRCVAGWNFAHSSDEPCAMKQAEVAELFERYGG